MLGLKNNTKYKINQVIHMKSNDIDEQFQIINIIKKNNKNFYEIISYDNLKFIVNENEIFNDKLKL